MKKKKKIHFVGIGGIGVSSLARYYLSEGYEVTGSDNSPCEDLRKSGAKIFQGHDEKNITEDTELVVYSTAISPGNKEILQAKRMNIKTQNYPQALGKLTEKFHTIAVSGTHGKSTTTAMLALVMIRAGLDPTVIIGTKLEEFGGINFRKGRSKYLLIEADEFKAALLNYYPEIAIITNIEEDHLDYYKDLDHILDTFKTYLKNNLKKGTLVFNADDERLGYLKEFADGKTVDYSILQKEAEDIHLKVPGKHNLSNALAVLTASNLLKIYKKTALKGLEEFKGTWRRFQESEVTLKSGVSVKIINDYAHHPTAVRATLEAVQEKYGEKKKVVIFQPHQYERTYRLFDQFVKTLSAVKVDKLLVSDIYTVEGRESREVMEKVSSEMLCKEVKNASYIGDLKSAEKYLLENLQGNEIVVIMGAGDIYNLESYIKRSN